MRLHQAQRTLFLRGPTLIDTHRFHACFTTSELDAVTADQTHRQHAIIEQIDADLKDSALAHLPSGVFTANAAWLVLATIAFSSTVRGDCHLAVFVVEQLSWSARFSGGRRPSDSSYSYGAAGATLGVINPRKAPETARISA